LDPIGRKWYFPSFGVGRGTNNSLATCYEMLHRAWGGPLWTR